ncbi:MAG: hypothetical protein MHM6MM_009220 [Cercozoa sp. M6MM]
MSDSFRVRELLAFDRKAVRPLRVVSAKVAVLEPRAASRTLQFLNEHCACQELSHLKRIRKVKHFDHAQLPESLRHAKFPLLLVLLCVSRDFAAFLAAARLALPTPSDAESDAESDRSERSEIDVLSKLSLSHVCEINVPHLAPMNTTERDAWKAVWPISAIPPPPVPETKFSEREKRSLLRSFARCAKAARENAKNRAELPIAVEIRGAFDESAENRSETGEISQSESEIAKSRSETAESKSETAESRNETDESESETRESESETRESESESVESESESVESFVATDSRSERGNCAFHAVLDAIERVAAVRRLEQQQEEKQQEKQQQGKQQEKQQAEHAGHKRRRRGRGGYICTDMDVVVSHEPCVM